jgi:tetratricopeptide (TPR) repeat protein
MARRAAIGIGSAVVVIVLLLAGIGLRLRSLHAQSGPAPDALTQSRLLALVAGNSLPEDVAARVQKFGLAFAPDSNYRAMLVSAGTDAKVLAAYDAIKAPRLPGSPANSNGSPAATPRQPTPPSASDQKALQHLADAAPLVKKKQFDDAARSVNDALAAGASETDCAFVMGEILRQREDFGQAQAVYTKILEDSPNFPEAEVKLSYIAYRYGDPQEAFRLAKTALATGAGGAEGHKNAALALESMRKMTAAADEYHQALILKPDYSSVYYDLGNLQHESGQLNAAVESYKHSIALDPNEPAAHNNLAGIYAEMGQFDTAVHEYREAKRLDPNMLEARGGLARALLHSGQYQEAAAEFKELAAMNPGDALCHDCYGTALLDTWDLDGAEKQFTIASQLDPSDAAAHLGLGGVRETQKRYDEALVEYRKATDLDSSLADPYAGAARVLMFQGKNAEAVAVLKQGLTMRPDSAKLHDLLSQASSAASSSKSAPAGGAASASSTAVEEAKAALALDPQNVQTMLHLAAAYDKSGDLAAGLNEYQQAAARDASEDFRGKVIRSDQLNPKTEYEAAQKRWDAHIASLRATGKSGEADALEAKLRADSAAPSVAAQVDTLMKAGHDADQVRDFAAAVADYKQAVALAETMQPHDDRLVTSLDRLGMNVMGQDPATAQAAFEREYKVACEIYGAQSHQAEAALQSLGQYEVFKKDYVSGEHHLFQAVDIANRNFGEGSDESAKAILIASGVYLAQKDYPKAEPYVLRAVRTQEAIMGKDSPGLMMSLNSLCYLYDQWGKQKEADACYQQMLPILEKQYGKNSPVEVSILSKDAKALRGIGRDADADAVEKRVAAIRAGTMTPN